jgi:hypothetical protein
VGAKQKRDTIMTATTTKNTSKTEAPVKSKNRFEKIVTDRPMYRMKKCDKLPLVGHLLGLIAMPPAELTPEDVKLGRTGEWNAFVILTTEPTLACVGEDVKEIPVGTEVIVGEGAKLSELRRYLYAPDYSDKMLEVHIQTTGTISLKGSKNMRTFDIGFDFEHALPRPKKYALTVAPPLKQLARGVEGDDADEAS